MMVLLLPPVKGVVVWMVLLLIISSTGTTTRMIKPVNGWSIIQMSIFPSSSSSSSSSSQQQRQRQRQQGHRLLSSSTTQSKRGSVQSDCSSFMIPSLPTAAATRETKRQLGIYSLPLQPNQQQQEQHIVPSRNLLPRFLSTIIVPILATITIGFGSFLVTPVSIASATTTTTMDLQQQQLQQQSDIFQQSLQPATIERPQIMLPTTTTTTNPNTMNPSKNNKNNNNIVQGMVYLADKQQSSNSRLPPINPTDILVIQVKAIIPNNENNLDNDNDNNKVLAGAKIPISKLNNNNNQFPIKFQLGRSNGIAVGNNNNDEWITALETNDLFLQASICPQTSTSIPCPISEQTYTAEGISKLLSSTITNRMKQPQQQVSKQEENELGMSSSSSSSSNDGNTVSIQGGGGEVGSIIRAPASLPLVAAVVQE